MLYITLQPTVHAVRFLMFELATPPRWWNEEVFSIENNRKWNEWRERAKKWEMGNYELQQLDGKKAAAKEEVRKH